MDPERSDGRLRIGRYTVVATVGEGPRGTVYLGQDGSSAPRAIKLLAPDADVVQRLESLRRVSGSHVSRVLDAGVWEGRPYLVREQALGHSLAEIVAVDGPLAGDELERVAFGVLTALTSIHLKGLTHGGLTPSNVILTAEGPKVTDMAVGAPVGEVGYRAPEQLAVGACGAYSDLFSWAAVVVFAGTGRPPFGQDAQAVLHGPPDLGDLPEPLRGLVATALAKASEQRPSAQAALLRLLGEEDKPPPPPAPHQPPTAHQPSAPQPSPQSHQSSAPHPSSAAHSVPPGPADSARSWGPPATPEAAVRSSPDQADEGTPARSFPVGLVAVMGAVVLLSGLGLWGASRYAGTAPALRPAAADAGNVSPIPSQGAHSRQPDLAVPWASASEPGDTTMPFELPTEQTAAPVPELSTVPTPAPPPVPSQPVPQPTTTVTRQPTATPTRSAAAKEQEPKKPTPTKTVTATAKPEPTPSTPAPSRTAPEISPGGGSKDIRTNYAWAKGSVSWNGKEATASGQLHDTPQRESRSWVRIAYKIYVSGAWKTRYAQPDPQVNAGNGQYAGISFSMSGPIKDVQWDLCSEREGKSYCTGWS